MWPSTTSPQRRKATQLACTRGQREARPVVCDNVDTHGGRLDDRVMQRTDWPTKKAGSTDTCRVRHGGRRTPAQQSAAPQSSTPFEASPHGFDQLPPVLPAAVRNAIDWLTRRWNHSALQDKPLAVIGPTEGCYSGAWARHHIEESGHSTETLVIEPITATTLREAVTGLAEQANIARATRAGQRYDPGLMTTLRQI